MTDPQMREYLVVLTSEYRTTLRLRIRAWNNPHALLVAGQSLRATGWTARDVTAARVQAIPYPQRKPSAA